MSHRRIRKIVLLSLGVLGFSGASKTAAAEIPRTQVPRVLKRGCRTKRGLGVLISPRTPNRKDGLRVLVVSNKARSGAKLIGRGPDGLLTLQVLRRGGPPYWWFAEIKKPKVGRYRFALVDADEKPLACASRRAERRPPKPPTGDVWQATRSWRPLMEDFYAAWIEKLFDSPINSRPSWTPLHKVLRDRKRNLLYNHLGASEDGPKRRKAVVVKPDCADLPYFLRAYFAWKMRLPMGYRHCTRGGARRASRCESLRTNAGQVIVDKHSAGRAFSNFLRRRLSYVHSGSGRTAAKDNETDLYPVRLTRKSLRPGTVYVDPYGHLLVISRFVPQTKSRTGLLFAIDGHPDLSVGRKRFWRGAFLFTTKIKGGGFKAFRPLALKGGQIVAIENSRLRGSGYRNFSAEQYRMNADQFYDRMDSVINPRPLAPLVAYRARLAALYELIQERVDSVQAGVDRYKKTNGREIKMPKGTRIFETSGDWENFSTPARDMRLLIAIADVLAFPKKVISQPQRFAIPAGQTPQQAEVAMRALAKRFMAQKHISYVKSDGSKKSLSMVEVVSRRKQFEMAYNPNDCPEIRWGATGAELESCKRRAPADQLAKMRKYRSWFATRSRPIRR
jgi:hypothetical protein